MIDEKIIDSLEKEDIVLCLRPTVINNSEWSGDVSISIMAGRDNPLNDEDYYSLLHFAKMVCASVPIMEKSEELRDVIHNYVLEEIDMENELDVELEDSDRGKVLDIKDNVVTLSFGSRTKGSA
tara:strand:+ start:3831 stop:4202 length:372 start_codon:yes stop_codon:yes gene_type:complete